MPQTYDNYYKRYYEENKGKLKERKNKQKLAMYQRTYYLKNREAIRAKRRQRYWDYEQLKNPERAKVLRDKTKEKNAAKTKAEQELLFNYNNLDRKGQITKIREI